MSSKPTMETSRGTLRPESWRARMLPIAAMSLKHRIAVNFWRASRRSWMPG